MSIKLQGKLSAYLACNPRAMATEQSTAQQQLARVVDCPRREDRPRFTSRRS